MILGYSILWKVFEKSQSIYESIDTVKNSKSYLKEYEVKPEGKARNITHVTGKVPVLT